MRRADIYRLRMNNPRDPEMLHRDGLRSRMCIFVFYFSFTFLVIRVWILLIATGNPYIILAGAFFTVLLLCVFYLHYARRIARQRQALMYRHDVEEDRQAQIDIDNAQLRLHLLRLFATGLQNHIQHQQTAAPTGGRGLSQNSISKLEHFAYHAPHSSASSGGGAFDGVDGSVEGGLASSDLNSSSSSHQQSRQQLLSAVAAVSSTTTTGDSAGSAGGGATGLPGQGGDMVDSPSSSATVQVSATAAGTSTTAAIPITAIQQQQEPTTTTLLQQPISSYRQQLQQDQLCAVCLDVYQEDDDALIRLDCRACMCFMPNASPPGCWLLGLGQAIYLPARCANRL
mmetsp:Transcript_32770/g.55250  ORF Transcript_32770/g.55250 Transcript_32770/m.55250 type:complete len:342 (+) Transcript_32770:88-1113(+)